MSAKVLSLLAFVTEIYGLDLVYYVSSNGIYGDICGTQLNPCSTINWTLYQANNAVNGSVALFELELIISGQNITDVKSEVELYSSTTINPRYHPCQIVSWWKSLTLTFNTEYIASLDDWYYKSICENGVNIDYPTLFQGYRFDDEGLGNSIIFNNLLFNDYVFSRNSLFRRMYSSHGDITVIFNNCSFKNISIHNDIEFNNIIASPKAVFNDCIFENISYDDTAFYDNLDVSFIGSRAVFGLSADFGLFNNCHFSNIYSKHSFIMTYNYMSVTIMNCEFSNIVSGNSLISLFGNDVTINNTIFNDIILGSIIVTKAMSIININNITITTYQTMNDNLNNNHQTIFSLFYISQETTATFNDITLTYTIKNDNIFNLCQHTSVKYMSKKATEIAIKVMGRYYNLTWLSLDCQFPVQFIQNSGVTNFYNIHLYNSFNESNLNKYYNQAYQDVNELIGDTKNTFWSFQYNVRINMFYQKYGLFVNDGYMNINGIYLYGSGHHNIIIANYGTLKVSNFITLYEHMWNDKQNCLRDRYGECQISNHTIRTDNFIENHHVSFRYTSVEIEDSLFFGGHKALELNGDNNTVLNSTFIYNTNAIVAAKTQTLKWKNLYIENVKIINCGKWYSLFMYDGVLVEYMGRLESSVINLFNNHFTPVLIFHSNITIKNSYFSYYEEGGFFYIQNGNAIMENNVFDLNYYGILWDINTRFQPSRSQNILFDGCGLITAYGANATLQFIGNLFEGNHIQPSWPLLCVYTKTQNCLSGNNITGYAVNLVYGNITSCNRPNIITFMDNDEDTYCSAITLGYNYDIKYQNNIFNADDPTIPLIRTRQGTTFGLENIIITSHNNYSYNDYRIYDYIYGNIIFYDVNISHNLETNITKILEPKDTICNITCYEIYLNDARFISQFKGKCNVDNYHKIISYNNISIPYRIELIPQKSTYFPGDRLKFNYNLYDKYDNILNYIDERITIELVSDELSATKTIVIGGNPMNCDVCDAGLFFDTIHTNNINQTYILSTSASDNQLFINNVTFEVAMCPVGYGTIQVSNVADCIPCDINTYSLLPNINKCNNCDNNNVKCSGLNNILFNKHSWIAINGFTNINTDFDLLNNNDNNIIYSECPIGYCCLDNECNYYNGIINNESNICAFGRDPLTPLCGKCIDGYSEVYNSFTCQICSNNNLYLLCIPVVAGFCVFGFFVCLKLGSCCNTNKLDARNYDNAKCRCFRCEICDKISCINIEIDLDTLKLIFKSILFKILFYYYQQLNFIFIYVDKNDILLKLITIFNINININVGSGICILPNLTADFEILLDLIMPLSCIFPSLILYSFGKCLDSKNIGYSKVLVSTVLICLLQILNVLFKLLSCQNVGNIKVHYYFGSKMCFSIIWWLSLILFILILIIILIMFIKMYNSDNLNESQFISMIEHYNDNNWYWEYILLLRRIFIAFFSVLGIAFLNDKTYSYYIILVILIISLIIQQIYIPFKHYIINFTEKVCLYFTLIALFVVIRIESNDEFFNTAVLSFIIIFPLIMFAVFIIILVFIYCMSSRNMDVTSFQKVKTNEQ